MKRFQHYVFRQMTATLLAVAGALTVVAFLTQSLGALDLIIDQRQNADVFLKVTLLALPQLGAMILPVAVFVGILVCLNRLHLEQEVVAAQAAGLSRWQSVSPALRIGCFGAILILLINLWVQPLCYREMRRTVFAAKTDLASALVREGEFSHPAKGLTVFTSDTNTDGVLSNVFLHDESKADEPITYMAQSGRIVSRPQGPALVMRKGSRQSLQADGDFGFLSFDEYVFDLSPYVNTKDTLFYKLSDRYLHELFFPDTQRLWESRNQNKLWSEGHYRLASPLYAPAFAVLAALAILGGSFSRLGYGRRIFWASMGVLFVRVLGFAAQSASVETPALNVLQYAVPVVALIWGLYALIHEPPQVRAVIRKLREARA